MFLLIHLCLRRPIRLNVHVCFFFVQCHHMSLWTSWSSLLGIAGVQRTSEVGTPMRRSYVVPTK